MKEAEKAGKAGCPKTIPRDCTMTEMRRRGSFKGNERSTCCGSAVRKQEDMGSLHGLPPWVKNLALP